MSLIDTQFDFISTLFNRIQEFKTLFGTRICWQMSKNFGWSGRTRTSWRGFFIKIAYCPANTRDKELSLERASQGVRKIGHLNEVPKVESSATLFRDDELSAPAGMPVLRKTRPIRLTGLIYEPTNIWFRNNSFVCLRLLYWFMSCDLFRLFTQLFQARCLRTKLDSESNLKITKFHRLDWSECLEIHKVPFIGTTNSSSDMLNEHVWW